MSCSAREVADQLAARGERLRGECVIVVAGCQETASRARPWPEALLELRGDRSGRELSAEPLVDVLACVYPGERNAIYRAVRGDWD